MFFVSVGIVSLISVQAFEISSIEPLQLPVTDRPMGLLYHLLPASTHSSVE
jgi:hypothetical protein